RVEERAGSGRQPEAGDAQSAGRGMGEAGSRAAARLAHARGWTPHGRRTGALLSGRARALRGLFRRGEFRGPALARVVPRIEDYGALGVGESRGDPHTDDPHALPG